MIFSHFDLLFLYGFALGVALFVFFGPALFERIERLFRKSRPAQSIELRIGLDAAAFRTGISELQSAIANLNSTINQEPSA